MALISARVRDRQIWKADRVDRRTLDTERQVVVVARERHGDARTWVVGRESDAVPMIRANIASGTTVHADEAGGWDILHASYPMMRVNHSVEYKSEDGASTNWAKSYFSGSAAPSSACITASAAIGSRPTRTKWRGARTIVASRTALIGT